jgi:uncharacterized membrane protein YfcA
MDALTLVGLGLAAGAAGAVNAIAGGGTLISFPSLLAAGYSAKVANVTSTVAIWPGTVGGSFAYRREINDRMYRLKHLSIPSVLGAAVGSVLLLMTSQRAFDAIVPFLILFASGLLAVNAPLGRFAMRHGLASEYEEHMPRGIYVAVFLVGIYGGYFGAGIGILMLAFISILAPDDIQHANAIKGVLALLMNFVALLIFAAFGPVEWGPALVMAVCAVVGGYAGVSLARRLNASVLRGLIVAWGVVTAVALFLR